MSEHRWTDRRCAAITQTISELGLQFQQLQVCNRLHSSAAIAKMPLAIYVVLKPLFVRLIGIDHGKPAWDPVTVPASYVVGSIASYWMIDRIVGFWS